MQEQSSKPPMDDYDKALVDYLNKLIDLDKAGKLEYFTHEQIFGEARNKIAQAEHNSVKKATHLKLYHGFN